MEEKLNRFVPWAGEIARSLSEYEDCEVRFAVSITASLEVVINYQMKRGKQRYHIINSVEDAEEFIERITGNDYESYLEWYYDAVNQMLQDFCNEIDGNEDRYSGQGWIDVSWKISNTNLLIDQAIDRHRTYAD